MGARTAFCLALLVGSFASLPVHARDTIECDALFKTKGGRILKSYVMDFKPNEKVYAYLVQTNAGTQEMCMSNKPLKR